MDTLKSRPTRGKVRDLDRSANLVCYSENLSVRFSYANRTSSSLVQLTSCHATISRSAAGASLAVAFLVPHLHRSTISFSVILTFPTTPRASLCMRLLFARRTDAPSVRFFLRQEYLQSRARTFPVAKISSLPPIHSTVKTHDHRNLVSFNAKFNPTSRGSTSGTANFTKL